MNDQTCDSLVPTIQALINDDVQSFSGEFSSDLETQKCISEKLKTNEVGNLIMEKAVLLMTKSLVPAQKLKEFQAKVSNATERLTKVAVGTCKGKIQMSRLFDQIYKFADLAEIEAGSENKIETIEDYCSRKYVVDNKLVDLNIYNVVLNPANLDIGNAKCEAYIENLFKSLTSRHITILGDPEKAQTPTQKCLFARFNEINFNDRMMGVFMLQELKINQAQKKFEREKFANEVNKLTVTQCLFIKGL